MMPKTRGEKLLPIREFVSRLPRVDMPTGSFDMDTELQSMDARGWVDRSRIFDLRQLRREVADGLFNAHTQATSVYNYKADRGFRKAKVATAQKLQTALREFIADNREDARLIENIRTTHPQTVESMDFTAIADAENLLKSLDRYTAGIKHEPDTKGDTGDHFQKAFTFEMTVVFRSITGNAGRFKHGQKEALMRLAAAVWRDMRLDGFEDEAALFERVKKWFRPGKGKV